ncbi:GNAT family N-acetyltransferase [Terrabacter lapilli]|uniref:GNAT family N-acetyltransferase n=1 Tax=Terrabacter lapilli TaxID=436231 RepID=A0ABP5CKG3_9MICO
MSRGRGQTAGIAKGRLDRLCPVTDDFTIRPIDVLDPEQDDAARQWIDVHASVQRELFAERGSAWPLEELQALHRTGTKKRVDLAAWSCGRVVGALEVQLPLLDNTDAAMLWLSVRAEARGRGIGAALLAQAERIGVDHGRSLFFAETEWAEGGHDASESFATAHGFVVGMTVVRSEMALPADRVTLGSLVSAPGAGDYVFDGYVDHMPQAWLADRAVLQQRMSTDAPTDGLALEEEAWDADRLREQQERLLSAGRRIVETVARHEPTGRIVGFTQVSVSASEPALGYQQDTLVLREHRGHGLGLRLKAANALAVMDALPGVTAVRTWNAASNEHMLAVNRRLGYTTDGWSREWQKRLRGGPDGTGEA